LEVLVHLLLWLLRQKLLGLLRILLHGLGRFEVLLEGCHGSDGGIDDFVSWVESLLVFIEVMSCLKALVNKLNALFRSESRTDGIKLHALLPLKLGFGGPLSRNLVLHLRLAGLHLLPHVLRLRFEGFFSVLRKWIGHVLLGHFVTVGKIDPCLRGEDRSGRTKLRG